MRASAESRSVFLGRLSPDSPDHWALVLTGTRKSHSYYLKDNALTLLWYPTLCTDRFTEVWDILRFIASVLRTKEQ